MRLLADTGQFEVAAAARAAFRPLAEIQSNALYLGTVCRHSHRAATHVTPYKRPASTGCTHIVFHSAIDLFVHVGPIYIFIHHQDGSTVDIRRLNKIQLN